MDRPLPATRTGGPLSLAGHKPYIGLSEAQSAAMAAGRVPKAELPAWRLRKAEATAAAALKTRNDAERARNVANAAAHNARAEKLFRAAMDVASPWSSLREAMDWFRREWQDVLPRRLHEGWSTVEDKDLLGGPTWDDRFKDYVFRSDGRAGEQVEPLREAFAVMRLKGNSFERIGAAYLFALASMDFDINGAALAMGGHCFCLWDVPDKGITMTPPHHGKPCPMPSAPLMPEYAGWYAEKAIDRLRERTLAILRRPPRAVEKPDWIDATKVVAEG